MTIHRVLTRDLARSLRIQHGLLVDGVSVSIDQVRYLLDALAAQLTPADGDDTGEQALLDLIADRIITAFIPPPFAAPRELALDATAVKAYARGKRRDPQDADDQDVDIAPESKGRCSKWGVGRPGRDLGLLHPHPGQRQRPDVRLRRLHHRRRTRRRRASR